MMDGQDIPAITEWMAKIAGWPGLAGYRWVDGQDCWMARTFRLSLDGWPRFLDGQDLPAITGWMAKIAGRPGLAGYRWVDGQDR